MSSPARSLPKPLLAATSKVGLTKPGVVVMQTLLIAIFTSFDLFVREGTGTLTGVAICLATLGTIRFARAGTEFVSAATAPLAFASVALISLIAIDGIHPSRLGVDSAAFGWINFLRSRAKINRQK